MSKMSKSRANLHYICCFCVKANMTLGASPKTKIQSQNQKLKKLSETFFRQGWKSNFSLFELKSSLKKYQCRTGWSVGDRKSLNPS